MNPNSFILTKWYVNKENEDGSVDLILVLY